MCLSTELSLLLEAFSFFKKKKLIKEEIYENEKMSTV